MNPELRFKDQDGNAFPDWEEKKIKEIGEVCSGGTPNTNEPKFWNGEIQWFTPSEVGKDKYVYNSLRTISASGLKKSSACILPINTLLVSTRATLGEISIAKKECSTNQGFHPIIVNNDNDNEFIYYCSPIIKKYCFENASGSTFLEISKKKFEKCLLPIANIEEQKKIAKILSDIDKKIESQATLVEKFKNTKDAMLVKMFPQGESKVPEIRFDGFSGDWKKIDVRYLINEAIIEKPMDGNHGEKHPVSSEYVEDGIPFLMASDVKDGKVDLDNCKFISKSRAEKLDKGFARNNDVLLTHKATIGETAILTGLNTEYAMLTPQVTYYRIIDNKKLNHFYLYSAFMSKQFQKDIHIAATQSTRSYIGIVKQHKLKIWFPIDIQEQEKIGQFFSNLDKEIEINQQKYEKLCDVKKALLSKLFPTKEDE